MSVAQELHHLLVGFYGRTHYLDVSNINRVENANDRIDDIVNFIESSHNIQGIWLNQAPASDELGRRVSHAIVSNPHTHKIVFDPYPSVAMRDFFPWITGRGAGLSHMTSLEKIAIFGADRMSVRDWDFIFSLLLTRTSLRELVISFNGGCDDAVMSALTRYLGASFLIAFKFVTNYSLSEAAFAFLCDGVAESTLQTLTLGYNVVARERNLETAAESLARAIAVSSLEEVTIMSALLRSSLSHTLPVRNLDFCVSEIDGVYISLKINRKWKPLLASANVPLALWSRILEKAHASPETSHGPAGILYYILREKPELVP
jgi:hypothetical protein